MDISGRVRKVVKRDGHCRLMIQPDDVPSFIVFEDCRGDVETVISRKIRKGSIVLVCGKLLSFRSAPACLSDCCLQMPEGAKLEQVRTQKKRKAKT